MLPRINSGEVLAVTEARQSDNDDTVLVPKSVQEGGCSDVSGCGGAAEGRFALVCACSCVRLCARLSLAHSLARVSHYERAGAVRGMRAGVACTRAVPCRACVRAFCVCVCVYVCVRARARTCIELSQLRPSGANARLARVLAWRRADSELLDDSNESGSDTMAAGGGADGAADLDSSVDSSGVQSDNDDGELLGSR